MIVPVPTRVFSTLSSRLTAMEASTEMSLALVLVGSGSVVAPSLSPRASGSVPAVLALLTLRLDRARISTVSAVTIRLSPICAPVPILP